MPQLVPKERVRAGAALLDPADVQAGCYEVDLIPAQVGQFGRSQAMSVGHEDHRAVPMTPSVSLGGRKQPLDLSIGKVFAGAQVGIGTACRSNCSFFGGWRDQLEVRLDHVFGSSLVLDCSKNAPITNSMQEHVTVQCRTGPLSRGSPLLEIPNVPTSKKPQ